MAKLDASARLTEYCYHLQSLIVSSDADVTELLAALSAGRTEAMDEIMPVIYQELRQLAHRHLDRERPGHTLSTTALVHEAYLKLVKIDRVEWKDRTHFLAIASRAMRRILIDHARTRTRDKRGGTRRRVSLEQAFNIADAHTEDLLALDDALTRLEEKNERQARVIEYRFFGGLSLEETAAALGVSVATVKRDWALTRAWLNAELAD
jgi:RNA polymerase sigma factor (TIGR02999 family)